MLDLTQHHQPTAALLATQLEQVALIFERQLASELSAVNALCLHIEKYRGKMLRPSLVLLAGLAAGRPPGEASALTETHRIVAAVAEMIHMATLVHDDVLDEADVRRGGGTVNSLWGNEAAVMLGDYLISNAFHLCSTADDPAINLALGAVTNRLCEGELVQLHHRHDYGIDEDTYLEIVRRKTASLIGECCGLGAVLAGADAGCGRAMRRFGSHLGVAFQVQDDLLDLMGEEQVTGKSLGKDLDKGKLTLPVIYYLAGAGQSQRGEALRLIESRDVPGLVERLLVSGAIDQASRTARRHVDEAKEELRCLSSSPARDLLATLADRTVDRDF